MCSTSSSRYIFALPSPCCNANHLYLQAILSQFARGINDVEDDKDEAHEDDAEAAAEADEAREAADQALIDALDDEDLQVILTPEDLQHGCDALHKVSYGLTTSVR